MLSAYLGHRNFLKVCRRIVRLSPHKVFAFFPLRLFLTSSFLSDSIAPKKTDKMLSIASDWNCPKCVFRNFAIRRSCRRCGHFLTENVNTNAHKKWQCSGCNSINYIGRKKCHECGTPKPEKVVSLQGETAADGSWFCASCEFRNFPIRDTCFRCETMVTDKQLKQVLERSGIWECSVCGNKNYPARKECKGCNSVRSAK